MNFKIMAKIEEKPVVKKTTKYSDAKQKWSFPLGRMNMYYLLAGLGVILLGYALMATGITDDAAVVDGKWNNPLAVTVAPLLLVIGYCVIIPLGLLKKFNKSADNNAQ